MKNEEKKLSRYIDSLNAGRKPVEHTRPTDEEYERLLETVRQVRLLKEPEYPGEEYPMHLAEALLAGKTIKKANTHLIRKLVFAGTLVAAAAVLLFTVPKYVMPHSNSNIVYAMEKAFDEVRAYHGVIEVIEKNELGETMIQATREVWADEAGNYYVKELLGSAAGMITVNNGDRKWQLRPEEQTAYLYATIPDPYRFTFELGQEIEEVKAAQMVKAAGTDTVAGRKASILEITPDGGDSYRLWIDQKTKLPLRRESAMQNAIQYTVTYSSIEFMDQIPAEYMQYQLPKGYQEADLVSEQLVSTLEEAENFVGFSLLMAKELPKGYGLIKLAVSKDQTAVSLYYSREDEGKTVVVKQSRATGDLKPAAAAVLARVGASTAEVIINPTANSIRWQEEGREYTVLGEAALAELTSFVKAFTKGEVILPARLLESGQEKQAEDKSSDVNTDPDANIDPDVNTDQEPQVAVPVDLEAVENEQKSVDAGHSPWKLDPVYVSQVFASLLLSPEGIVGDYPIAYEDISIIQNDGVTAVAQINDDASIAAKVYLKRLLRQDESGIWTVIGYDKRKK